MTFIALLILAALCGCLAVLFILGACRVSGDCARWEEANRWDRDYPRPPVSEAAE